MYIYVMFFTQIFKYKINKYEIPNTTFSVPRLSWGKLLFAKPISNRTRLAAQYININIITEKAWDVLCPMQRFIYYCLL